MFDHDRQYDWAVLCSKNQFSSILIFWGGSTTSVSDIAKAADKAYLQVVDGEGKIGYSRAITALDKEYILEYQRWYGGVKLHRWIIKGLTISLSGKHRLYTTTIEASGFNCREQTDGHRLRSVSVNFYRECGQVN